jgi:YD repeat-containing protein
MLMLLMIFPSFFSRMLHSQSVSSRSLVDTLNAEAQADDVHPYCEHLIRILVGDSVSKGTINSLTDRLASAENAARRGERPPISEAEVAAAFNNMMSQIGAPEELRTDASMVHRFRVGPLSRSDISYLITLDRNGANCNPGEGVFLLYLLIQNNGTVEDHLPLGMTSVTVPSLMVTEQDPSVPDARRSIYGYAKHHRRSNLVEVFNHVAQTFHLWGGRLVHMKNVVAVALLTMAALTLCGCPGPYNPNQGFTIQTNERLAPGRWPGHEIHSFIVDEWDTTNAGRHFNYSYDAAGHVASIASNHVNGASMNYSYDDLNRLSAVADNRLNGATTTYSYDNANNVGTVTYPPMASRRRLPTTRWTGSPS